MHSACPISHLRFAIALQIAICLALLLHSGQYFFNLMLRYGAWFGTKFDSDPKRHRFTAVMALQASMLLEIITPMVP